MTLQPIEPVLGGVVDPEDLVGRERLVDAVTRAVAHGGAYIIGDRRMGKTSILRKVRAVLEDAGHVVLYVSAETDDLTKFEQALVEEIRRHPQLGKRWTTWTKEIEGEVSLQIKGTGARLRGSATQAADTTQPDIFVLCAQAAAELGAPAFVLLVDEVAQLAYHLEAKAPGDGEEFLRALRRLRQSQSPRTAVVLSGSVGLHHAVHDTTVLNDVPRVEVGPLTRDDAEELAQRILLAVYGEPHPNVAREIASATDGIPYYIHGVVHLLDQRMADPAGARIDEIVTDALDQNEWDTDHYYERISKYYPSHVDLVVAALDDLAVDGPQTVDAVAASLTNRFFETPPERSTVGELLNNLRLDNYLAFGSDEYRFETEFLRNAWLRIRKRRG